MAATKKNKSKRLFRLSDAECVPLTFEQLELARTVGNAAATGLMVRQSFASKYEEAVSSGEIEPGEYLIPSDIPVNHAAMAIMDSFPEKTPEGDKLRISVLWRSIVVLNAVHADARRQRFSKVIDGQEYIARPLLEAVATTPVRLGEKVPLDAIFKVAEEIVSENGWGDAVES